MKNILIKYRIIHKGFFSDREEFITEIVDCDTDSVAKTLENRLEKFSEETRLRYTNYPDPVCSYPDSKPYDSIRSISIDSFQEIK